MVRSFVHRVKVAGDSILHFVHKVGHDEKEFNPSNRYLMIGIVSWALNLQIWRSL
jgi:hypothetical protein